MAKQQAGAENQGGADSGDDENKPEFVTVEQLNDVVTKAVTAHVKSAVSKATDKLANTLKDTLDEKLKDLAPKPPSDDDDGATKDKKPDPKTTALEQEVANLKKLYESERSTRLAEAEKAKKDRAFNDLRAGLQEHVRPDTLNVLAKYLDADGRVLTDDDGNVLFKVKRNTAGIDEEVELPLADGIKTFLKSDEAKPFLPAPDGGKGNFPVDRQGQRKSSTSTGYDPSKAGTGDDVDKVRRAADLERVLKEMQEREGNTQF